MSTAQGSRAWFRTLLVSAPLVIRSGSTDCGTVVEVRSSPASRRWTVGAAVFGRLLNDLKDWLQPSRLPQFVPVLVLGRGIDRELAEQALAHAVGSQVEQCYARSDVLEPGSRSWRHGERSWSSSGRTGHARPRIPAEGGAIPLRLRADPGDSEAAFSGRTDACSTPHTRGLAPQALAELRVAPGSAPKGEKDSTPFVPFFGPTLLPCPLSRTPAECP